MSAHEKLTSVDIIPTELAEKCVIWLHGLGADGHDFAPIIPDLALPQHLHIKYIFPHAPIMPITINNGYEMRAWFDISHDGINGKIDNAGISQSIAAINTLIAHEEANGVASENIMLAGFSQGAVIALMTGILSPKRLAGIIALSGLLPQAEAVIQEGSKANRDIPIFIGHGSQDQMVDVGLGKSAYDALTRASYPAVWHEYAMGHSVCGEEIRDISGWMQGVWIPRTNRRC